MKQPKAPCLHCEVRKPACQQSCTLYGQYIKQHGRYKAVVAMARQAEKVIARQAEKVIDDFKYERAAYTKRQMER